MPAQLAPFPGHYRHRQPLGFWNGNVTRRLADLELERMDHDLNRGSRYYAHTAARYMPDRFSQDNYNRNKNTSPEPGEATGD
jgi:hypothetical protein